MSVYTDPNSGCVYSCGPEFDEPECQAKGGLHSYFSQATQLTSRHNHICRQLPNHKGQHTCEKCDHKWD